MERILLSIIIPIYNVEAFLSVCIDSVLSLLSGDQTEVILVDDGSTDRSGEIAEDYASRYNGITVIHDKNQGLSHARNRGLSQARGDFVFFLDSDDMIDPEAMHSVMLSLDAFDGDLVLWDARLIKENGEPFDGEGSQYYTHTGLVPFAKSTGEDCILLQLIDHRDYISTVWLGAYRRDFLMQNNFLFENGLLHEDELWTPKVLLAARSVCYFPLKLYLYRIREASITRSQQGHDKNIRCLIYIFESLYKYYDMKLNNNNKLCKLLKGNLSARYLHMISRYNAYLYPDLFKKIDRRCILKNARGIKNRLRAILLLTSGRLYCTLSRRLLSATKIK